LAYSEGEGVSRNFTEARRLYGLAADQGNAQAQYSLGLMFLIGQGVARDYVEAHMWFDLATSQSSGGVRATYVQQRDDLAARMTRDEIVQAQRRAREWTPTPEP
jgi:TPR repeat protein